MADLSEGQQEEQTYRQNGFNDADIDQWKQQLVQTFQKNGFSAKDINDYFGVKDPDVSDIQRGVAENLEKWKDGRKDESGKMPPHEATTFGEGLTAAWQGSVFGTMARGGAPADVLPPEHQGFLQRMAEKFEQYGLDAPFMAAGGAVGAIAGAPAGAAVGGLAGIPAGVAAGAGFGAFAAPTFIREMLMQHYQNPNGIHDPQEFMAEVGSAAWKATKDGIPGAIGAATGAIAKPLLGATTALGAEYMSMVGSQAAIAGHLPSWNEFQDGALMMGVLHTPEVASKLMNIYAKTGERAADIAEAAHTDPVIKQELVSENPQEPEQAAPKEEPQQENAIPLKKPETPEGEEPDDVSKSREVVLSRRAEDQSKPNPSWLTPSEFVDNLRSAWDKFYDSAVNKVASLGRAEDKAGFESENGGLDSPYQRALNYTSWRGKMQRAFQFNTIDYATGKANGEGLETVLKDIKPEDQRDFLAYAMSRRAVERDTAGPNGEGKETGIPLEDAKKVVEADKDRFGDVFDRLVGFNNRMLKYAKDADLISIESYARIVGDSKDYLPLLRQQDIDEFLGEPQGGGGRIAPEMKGSDKAILDPIESIYRNTARIFEAAERNAVGLNFAKMVENAENGEALAAKVEQPTGATNEFTFLRKGNKETWKTSPEFADGIKALNYDPGMSNLFLKLLMGPGSWLRTGTVLSPDFIMRHGIRQLETGQVYSQSVKMPFVDSMKFAWNTMLSIKDVAGHSEDYQKFLSSGGTAGEIRNLNQYFQDQNIWTLNKDTGNWMDKTWNVLRKPIQGLQWAAHISDTAQRVAEFKLLGGAKEGATPAEISTAGSAAREVTLDYDRSGSQTKIMRALTPFMNIGIQGTDRLLRSMKDDPVGTATKAAMAITLPTIANWAINHKDSRYQDAPQWEKDLYWLFPQDKWEKAQNPMDAMARPEDLRRQLPDGSWEVNNGTTVKISKPFELGVIFGSLPERLLSKYFDENPHQLGDFLTTIRHGITPNIIPSVFVPPIETMTNHNLFMDRPIVPDQLQKVAPEMQYMPYTSSTAKTLGKMLGYVPGLSGTKATSPLIIDNWIREWSGTGGQYALQTIDAVANRGERPAMEMADIPFVKAFVQRNPSMNMQPIQDFYEAYDKAKVVMDTAQAMTKAGRPDSAAEYIRDHNGYAMAQLEPIQGALRAQSSLVKAITDSKYPPDQKRQLIDTAYYQMWNMAKQGAKIMQGSK